MRIDEPKRDQPFNQPFKLERVHRTILKEAEKNGGIYSLSTFLRSVKEKHPNDIKMQKQLIQWNQTTVHKMVEAGLLIQKSPLEYKMANAEETTAEVEISLTKHWKPGKNHIRLLQKNKDGTLKSLDLKKDCKGTVNKRQNKMIDGMLRKLCDYGYLERTDRGIYQLTEAAFHQLEKAALPHQKKAQSKEVVLKITAFDSRLKEILNEKGEIDRELLQKHPRGGSLEKRIKNLKNAKMIDGNKPTIELLQQIEKVEQWKKQQERQKELRIEDLTPKQKQVIDDMRVFQNLTYKQMEKYIYLGEQISARTDIDYLVKNKILKKDTDIGVYVFDKKGVILSNRILEMEGKDLVKYSSKLFSRKEEMEHDMLVYTAYQELRIQLKQKGCKILSVKNDRQLRREDALQYGHMLDGYPDLRIEYMEPKKILPTIHDLEIDCGYDRKTIQSKIEKTNKGNRRITKRHQSRFTWVCNTVKQAAKVGKAMQNREKAAPRQRPELYIIDKDGRMLKVKDL